LAHDPGKEDAMVKEFATRHGSALRSLAVVVGTLATAATVIVPPFWPWCLRPRSW
jgi:hypothetical protein